MISGTPPEALYHYTNQDGLIGIMKTKQLWATKVQYLNDTTEFNLAINLGRDQLSERLGKVSKPIAEILKRVIADIENILNVNICVVSFCEDSDLLSQWRGYAGSGGVAIGFRSEFLARLAKIEGGCLGNCIYEKYRQIKIVEKIIDNMIETIDVTEMANADYPRAFEYFQRHLIESGAFFKDQGFKEEKEWRIVTGIKLYREPEFQFRSERSMLMPYFEIELLRDPPPQPRVLLRETWGG